MKLRRILVQRGVAGKVYQNSHMSLKVMQMSLLARLTAKQAP